jgi:hypothetical protein
VETDSTHVLGLLDVMGIWKNVVYGNRFVYIDRFVNVGNQALLRKFSDLKVVIAEGL